MVDNFQYMVIKALGLPSCFFLGSLALGEASYHVEGTLK